jgi:hypothetical protein
MPFMRRHWSRTGRREARAGGGLERKDSGLSGQNCFMMTPWGMYMKPRRTGGLAAAVGRESAQPMDSRSGREREAPRPLRQVRRSRRWWEGIEEVRSEK